MTDQQNLADQMKAVVLAMPGKRTDPLRQQALASIQQFEAERWDAPIFRQAATGAYVPFEQIADPDAPIKLARIPASGRVGSVSAIVRLLNRYSELINV